MFDALIITMIDIDRGGLQMHHPKSAASGNTHTTHSLLSFQLNM